MFLAGGNSHADYLFLRRPGLLFATEVLNQLLHFATPMYIQAGGAAQVHDDLGLSAGRLRLEEAYAWTPGFTCGFWVHHDLVGKRVLIGRGNGRYVVFVLIYNVHDLESGFLEGLGHGAADFKDV
jgi:hypothetical protein